MPWSLAGRGGRGNHHALTALGENLAQLPAAPHGALLHEAHDLLECWRHIYTENTLIFCHFWAKYKFENIVFNPVSFQS
jgi:hypothetical protein